MFGYILHLGVVQYLHVFLLICLSVGLIISQIHTDVCYKAGNLQYDLFKFMKDLLTIVAMLLDQKLCILLGNRCICIWD